MPAYGEHYAAHEKTTFLPHFLLLFRLSVGGESIDLALMTNIYLAGEAHGVRIEEKYDLTGASASRAARNPGDGTAQLMDDLDFVGKDGSRYVSIQHYSDVIGALTADVNQGAENNKLRQLLVVELVEQVNCFYTKM